MYSELAFLVKLVAVFELKTKLVGKFLLFSDTSYLLFDAPFIFDLLFNPN
jgi:hypothetical protein